MCQRDVIWNSAKFIGTISVIAATVIPVSAQQRPTSPLAGAPVENRYPDGSKLQSQYSSVQRSVVLPSAAASVRANSAGFASAAAVQTDLPEGFSLLAAPTSHVGGTDQPVGANMAPATAADPAASSTEKFITVFPLAYRGVPLSKGSDYLTIVGGDGRIQATRKRAMPTKVDATQPTVSAAEAIQVARKDAGATFAGPDPKPELQIWVDDQQNGNLSWTFTLSSAAVGDPNVRKYWIAAVGEPRVLNWESEVYHTHSGLVSGNIWAASPFQPTESRAFPRLEVTRLSDGVKLITGADGRYGYTTPAASTEIRAKLRGPWFIINNQSGPGLESAQTGPASPPISLNLGATGEDQLAQDSAFYWSNFARDLARTILGPADLPNLPVLTNINQTCNAFWNGSSINFFKSGNGCPNTAYADVVMHEYGHGIDAAKGGIVNGGYSEGFGDAMAVLATRQPCVGRDFFGAGTCLRSASDVILWPSPGGVHTVGRPYGGFTWELIQQLKQTFSENEAYAIATRLVLGAAAANPSDIADAVRLSFIVDDNDGNLANGTPHFRALANAADSRKIPRPADPQVGGPSVAAAASFPWTPVKVVSANSNILQASIHLDKPGKVHISANTSARSASPVQFQTGVYNGAAANIVWTDSFRSLSLPTANQWTQVGTMFAIDLPAGDHTIYWKIWIAGGPLSLSAGALMLEAFEPAGGPSALTAAVTDAGQSSAMNDATSATTSATVGANLAPSAAIAVSRDPAIAMSRDEAGRGITTVRQ
jgi:hypothetical protein